MLIEILDATRFPHPLHYRETQRGVLAIDASPEEWQEVYLQCKRASMSLGAGNNLARPSLHWLSAGVVDVEFGVPASQGAWQFACERRPEDSVLLVQHWVSNAPDWRAWVVRVDAVEQVAQRGPWPVPVWRITVETRIGATDSPAILAELIERGSPPLMLAA